MPTFKFAKVDGSLLDADQRGRRELVAPGWVDDLDISGSADQEVLINALEATGMPAFGAALAGHTDMRLDRVVMRGSSTKFGRAYFDLVYSNQTGGDVNAYVIVDRSYVVPIQTQRIGNTWIRVSMDSAGEDQDIPEDNVTITYYMPMRALSVRRVIAGEVPDTVRAQVGKVNDDEWKGLDVGQWLVTEVASQHSRYGAFTAYNIDAVGFVDPLESWATYGVLRSEMTGRYARPSNTILSGLVSQAYTYGLTYPPTDDDTKGVVKIGPYRLTDFEALFGF